MQEKGLEQARLAKALVDSLGVEGAISACRANGWDGVLDYLNSAEIRDGLPAASPQPYRF